MDIDQNIVDDSGTGQDEAHKILRTFCDNGFDGDTERAALALGRDASDIQEMLDAGAEIDDDLVMKIRGIAKEREITID